MNKNINPRHMMLKSLFTHFLIVLIIFASAPQSSFAKDNSRYADATHTFDVVRDIEWAKPKGFSLKMDIYVPKTGKKSYPVIIVYHGGGWLLSPKEIMNDIPCGSFRIYCLQCSISPTW
jgi:acetyl esterase/lipase